MLLAEAKLKKRLKELEPYRYRDAVRVSPLKFCLDEKREVVSYPPSSAKWKSIRVGERWKGRDLYAWLTSDVYVPGEWNGKQVVGLFDFGKTGGGHNSGFESLLFVNGKPYQGVDSNHREVFLPESAPGDTVQLAFRLWSGLEGGGPRKEQEHEIRRAELAWLDEETDNLYYTARAVLEAVMVLEDNSAERTLLLQTLDRAFKQIDWSKPGSEAFYRSVHGARERLSRELEQLQKHHPVTVRCIGHTHIDVAWLWRLKHTREKCARSFSTVLRLMERYPEYVFLQTQPQLYDYVKADYPGVYEQIKERVKEGRWEAGGGMWVEADCNLPSGESLVRQLLFGTRFFRDEFGVECRYLWLPDVFGYSWALPQILKKSGIDVFMTTKISWNQYNRMPHDTFFWRGIDGSEVLTHFITTPVPDPEPGSWFYTYNGTITPETVKGIWDAYRDKTVNRELLLAYGYGDGGGGANRDMLEMRRRVDRIPGLPHAETGRADEYFARLKERITGAEDYVHTWDGELYLEYHRGTYTSQAYNKKMNRKLELMFRETEWLGAMASAVHADWTHYKDKELNEGWKIVLRNQFHDIIPGSSIREVYEDSREEYREAEKRVTAVWQNAVRSFVTPKDNVVTVFNSAPWTREDLVKIPVGDGMRTGEWTDVKGRKLEAERVGDQWLVTVGGLPPMGYSTLTFHSEKQTAKGSEGAGAASSDSSEDSQAFKLSASGIVTPFYELEWNSQGQLVKIYDRENRRHVLKCKERGNVLQLFEDKPLAFDAWDIDLFYQEKMEEVVDLVSVEVCEHNALRVVVRFTWQYRETTIKQDMIVYAKSRRIDFRTEVDWQETQRLLKVAFPVNIRATEATYDIQFGNVKRPTHWNTSWDYARFETVGHQWADLSERGYGVSLLNDSKYGYDIKDSVMRLSLLKSAVYPDTEADRGRHTFTYSLYPHPGDWLEGGTVYEAWALNQPLTFVHGSPSVPERSLFRISNPHVMIDAVKKSEDRERLILRVHDFSGGREDVEISSDFTIRSWQECNLMERPIGEEVREDRIRFHLNPYEIKTFLVDIVDPD